MGIESASSNLRRATVTALLIAFLSLAARAQIAGDAWLIDIEGAIGPATADHMIRGLDKAEDGGASMVILRIDTPGGLDLSMRTMIKRILAADIPVIGYVSPGGARAASAGTYLLYATHVAAMTPGTNLGAATPVQIGTPGMPTLPGSEQDEQQEPEAPLPGTAMERKVVNDAVAYIQGLAQMRDRNSEWAEKAVREGVSLSAIDALAENVIDLVSPDLDALLSALNGREVNLNGTNLVLNTDAINVYWHETDWRSELLAVITDPNVAYILMLLGIYGLLFEFYNPGIGVPGVIGAISLLLALYAFQVLPVSYAGLGLMVLGIGLMTVEALSPSFGVFGLGGIVAFVVGSIILMDTEVPGYQIALPLILAVAAFSAALLMFALSMLVKARRQAVVTGLDHLIGADATVEQIMEGVAQVRMDGELWQVHCDQPLQAGDSVRIDRIEGLTLEVRKN